MARVLVVGAGVVGLSCAVRLLEAGHQLSVVARDLPLETTSAVAGGLWYPHRAYPFERVTAWSATTYAELARLAEDESYGVDLREGTELLRTDAPPPWWAEAVPQLTRAPTVPPGYAAARRCGAAQCPRGGRPRSSRPPRAGRARCRSSPTTP